MTLTSSSFSFKRPIRATILLLVITSGFHFTSSSRLEFDRTSREYRNLLVAIEPSLNESTCQILLQNIKAIVREASARLSSAIDGRAKFGSVKILIPLSWNINSCNESSTAAAVSDSYDDADIKVSSKYVLAETMPFTRQYRNCGEESDDIFLPSEFLMSPEYNDSLKANMFLHEWAKFRYGVYEEHPYFGDEIYPACYSSRGTLRLTTCADVDLERLADSTSANCTLAVEQSRRSLLSQLSGATSSAMSFPDIPNIQKFCTNATHNKLANTKHNAICDRRSVLDVILNHPDFASLLPRNTSARQSTINFQIIQPRTSTYEAGYAFVIEDSEDIRNQSRLLYIKQSIVQMLNLIGPTSRILLWTFSGKVSNGPEYHNLATEAAKVTFVTRIPNLTMPPFTANLSPVMAKQAGTPNDLEFAVRTVSEILDATMASYKWEIFLITSSPSTAFERARDIIHARSHSLTVLTYDLDPAWLQLYTTSAVRNIIALPKCNSNGTECQGKVYSAFLDAFMDADRNQDTSHFFQKVVEAELSKGNSTTFVIPHQVPSVSQNNFHVLLTKFLATDVISVRSPGGTTCPTASVSNYDLVVRMDSSTPGCEFRVGTWTVDLSRVQDSVNTHLVQVILTSSDQTTSLRIKGTIGTSRQSLILPSSQVTPVFVRVTTIAGQPVINADVQTTLSSSTDMQWSSQVTLSDNGVDPDVVKNDGVYSAYIQSYSPDASPHVGRVTVETLSTKAAAVVSLTSASTATFLNINGTSNTSKCCGSFVPVGTTSAVGNSRRTSLLPGFQTGEAFNPSTLPPSRIGQVQISDDDGNVVTLQFVAPGSSLTSGTVAYYEACCNFFNPSTNIEESSCARISSPSDCTPIESGQNQTCRISRLGVYQDFLKEVPPPTTISLYCGIRGVNSNSIAGKTSSSLVEILVTLPLIGVCEPKALKCNSLSDECLPIAVFWGLIGCICGLVLVILALLICFCRAKKKSSQEVLMSRGNLNTRSDTPHLPDKDSPLYKVYVNQAYIQEADGQMKLVATDGELLPFDSDAPPHSYQPPISGPIPSVRRRSVSVSEMNRERQLANPSWGGSSPAVQEDMPIYKAQGPSTPAKPYPQANLYSEEASFGNRPPVPVPKNRFPRDSSGYANTNKDRNSTSRDQVPLPSISGAMGDPQVVYASVNRNGRRPLSNSNQPIASLLNGGGTSTFMRLNKPPEHTPTGSGVIANRFSRPSSGYQSEHNPSLPRSRPHSRLDAFPSSESDTYSDMSRGIPMAPRPPPVPPPFPREPSSGPPRTQKPSTLKRNSAERLNVEPRVTHRKANNPPPQPPPKYVPPPPAPPPKNNVPSSSTHRNNAGSQSDDDYDDDSEHWDDDDFDFNPGVSFA